MTDSFSLFNLRTDGHIIAEYILFSNGKCIIDWKFKTLPANIKEKAKEIKEIILNANELRKVVVLENGLILDPIEDPKTVFTEDLKSFCRSKNIFNEFLEC